MTLSKLVLRFKLWRLNARIEEEEDEQEALFFDRWVALEAQDAPAYDALGRLSHVANRGLARLRQQRDEIARQLERL